MGSLKQVKKAEIGLYFQVVHQVIIICSQLVLKQLFTQNNISRYTRVAESVDTISEISSLFIFIVTSIIPVSGSTLVLSCFYLCIIRL